MSRREKGSYGLLDNPVLAYVKTHHDASAGVLVALAERDNYTHLPAAMKVPEVMLETGLGQRAVEKCLVRLEAAGLAARGANGWAYSGTNSRANRQTNQPTNGHANSGANDTTNGRANDGSLRQPENAVQNGIPDSLKEVEGMGRNTEEEKTPLTPQGEPGLGEGKASPVPAQPVNPTPDARPAPPTDPEKVPRRRAPAAPAPVLPGDLAALPGVPEAWDRWLRYRTEARIRTPATTADEQFRKLRDLHAQGWDLPRIVAHAIEVGWKSFFPIRGEQPRQNLRLPPHDTAHADPDEKKDWLA
ncbi:hypothetical protein [Deinococcus gobiensis]|uniref:Uncharacterized protein n=1 Tax=Deinococcus gobiensis (strain DSM 21396 / JCM 16679 / CGMCC 1.7299 / I-0) TaxID=745776 RepID=H8H2K5_DEIGI|nr:hypothetical protein [Deinococcus gobiensis]AFD27752.1 hypothetical protein DGo_PB0483 [Deinococcus gobiensis I-0]